jgi:TM2 domain-containing membrane protein YozV
MYNGQPVAGYALLFILAYFFPGMVAYVRNHHNKVAILFTNAIFGWSIVGWLVAFIWAFTKPNPMQFVINNLHGTVTEKEMGD